jgi:GGDEF domain-containing protein
MDSGELPHLGTPLTVSIGVGMAAADADMQPQELIEAADAALYLAKQCGRNCVKRGATERSPQRQTA